MKTQDDAETMTDRVYVASAGRQEGRTVMGGGGDGNNVWRTKRLHNDRCAQPTFLSPTTRLVGTPEEISSTSPVTVTSPE
jgi:hypothetical protein